MVVLRCKICVVGDATVGKTAMVQMFYSNGSNFPKQYMMTMGVDLNVKAVPIEDAPAPTSAELYIFDIGGQQIYSRIIEQYLEGMSWFIVVYDVTNKESFDNCNKWVELCRKQRKNVRGLLVANKNDQDERIVVSRALGETFAKDHNLQFFEISALRGADVDAPFNHIAQQYSVAYEDKLKALSFQK
eukprot:TRINITY_DN1439_c0_g1_i1.p1 TRINITY_DN1439_c0_g1~~TRINITY_DN1439_c0_g1_i1.p1  ORF type:complete len:187 (+),score=42.17 TRINITY_DN1439_c0_g1_i1:101-661(+)